MADIADKRVIALWREASVAVAYTDADYVLRWLCQSEAPSNIIALQERATAALAECGRLREQLAKESAVKWSARKGRQEAEDRAGRLREQLDAAEAKAAACPVCSQDVPGPSWRKA